MRTRRVHLISFLENIIEEVRKELNFDAQLSAKKISNYTAIISEKTLKNRIQMGMLSVNSGLHVEKEDEVENALDLGNSTLDFLSGENNSPKKTIAPRSLVDWETYFCVMINSKSMVS